MTKDKRPANNGRNLFYVPMSYIFCTGIVVIEFILSNLLNQYVYYILISYCQEIENDNLYF